MPLLNDASVSLPEELDCNWRLLRMGEEGVPTYTEWLLGDANLDTSAGNVYL